MLRVTMSVSAEGATKYFDAALRTSARFLLIALVNGCVVILDYDKDANIVGIEILNASRRMEDPRSLEYAVT